MVITMSIASLRATTWKYKHSFIYRIEYNIEDRSCSGVSYWRL